MSGDAKFIHLTRRGGGEAKCQNSLYIGKDLK